jgi:hypothetical protein
MTVTVPVTVEWVPVASAAEVAVVWKGCWVLSGGVLRVRV